MRAMLACALVCAASACTLDTARLADMAKRAATALHSGTALVEPAFLTPDQLAAAQADVGLVFPHDAPDAADDFESIQTDLLDAAFRASLPALPFAHALAQLDYLRAAVAEATRRPLLDGGGLHIMRYPIGSRFMRHVDEDASLHEPVRNSVSFLLYLTPPEWAAADGGALRVWEEGATDARELLPLGGTLVMYDSCLEHEVTETKRVRLLLSGRWRELDDTWQRRRKS